MNKKIFLLFSVVLFSSTLIAQDFTGQWKGEFTDKSTASVGFGGDQCDYVLELECNGNKVTGSSYTYFTDGGKKYYTICTLEGFIDRKQKYIEVRETERTKTNVPVTIRNCFQVHKLTYFKHGDTATIKGTWEPAPDQQGGCGYGTTVLTRRVLEQVFPKFNNLASKNITPKKNQIAQAPFKTNPVITPPVKEMVKSKSVATPPVVKPLVLAKIKPLRQPVQTFPKNQTALALHPGAIPVDTTAGTKIPANIKPFEKNNTDLLTKYEKRNNTLLKTIEVENKTVKVDLYDNGEVDGDSISLFYNGKLLLSHKRLTTKAISLNIDVEDGQDMNELVMYAENLGTIPPNTALMVVTDGPNRYEVRITSDLQKSGVINFIHKPGVAGK